MFGVENIKSNSVSNTQKSGEGAKWWCDAVIHSLCTTSTIRRLPRLSVPLNCPLFLCRHRGSSSVRCANTFFRWCNKKWLRERGQFGRCLLLSRKWIRKGTTNLDMSVRLCKLFCGVIYSIIRLKRNALCPSMEILAVLGAQFRRTFHSRLARFTQTTFLLLLHARGGKKEEKRKMGLMRGKDYVTMARNFHENG